MRVIVVLLVIVMVVSQVYAQDTGCATSCGVSNEAIRAYPEPNVRPLRVDHELLSDRVYRRMEGAVTVHDAPNGTSTSTFGAGFNYVTVLSTQADWAEISPGRWVQAASLSTDVLVSTFAGVRLPEEPLPYPVGWILVHVRPSLTPGGDPSEVNPLLLRYTVVNLYAAVEVDGWIWYQVGIDQWVQQTLIARINTVERFEDVDTEKWISVDLYEQVVVAYEGSTPVFATLAASGLPGWDTNEGLFHVYLRYPRTVMSGGGAEDFYYLEEVPWTMYFDQDIALHGTYWHDGFGYRHSHGCVNLSITDAHWLYHWASSEFDFTVDADEGPVVYVYSSGVYR